MTSKSRELTKREQYIAAWRGFLLLGLMILGWAGYEYYRITDFEKNGGLFLWWKGFDDLYAWGGKWAVVGFLALCSGVFFVASLHCLRVLSKLPADADESPTQRTN